MPGKNFTGWMVTTRMDYALAFIGHCWLLSGIEMFKFHRFFAGIDRLVTNQKFWISVALGRKNRGLKMDKTV